jgi:predicted alpha/beta-fold hydrolase
MRPFVPLFRSPHILTILGNFWPRRYDFGLYPERSRLIQTDPDTRILVQTQHPASAAQGQVVLLHGLEGGGDSGYIRSMAWTALQAGFVSHRFHMRTCGGTERYCKTLYHAGLTSDLLSFLEQIRAPDLPVFLIGFSLGGNVALKIAGELGHTDLIRGVVAISAPIDLAACAERLRQRDNRLYERRFVNRMRSRLAATGRYTTQELTLWKSVFEIDDRITAPSFGFGNATNYYATQSAANFLERIRVPTLLIQAKDDTFIPFRIFRHPALSLNPNLRLLATEHGGHLGFLSRRAPRFWADETAIEFVTDLVRQPARALASK